MTIFSIDVFEPSSHDGKMQRISRHVTKRYSEFDKLRGDLLAAGNKDVAAIVNGLNFPAKTWCAFQPIFWRKIIGLK